MIKKLVAIYLYLLYEVGLIWIFHPFQYKKMTQSDMDRFGQEVDQTRYTIHLQ